MSVSVEDFKQQIYSLPTVAQGLDDVTLPPWQHGTTMQLVDVASRMTLTLSETLDITNALKWADVLTDEQVASVSSALASRAMNTTVTGQMQQGHTQKMEAPAPFLRDTDHEGLEAGEGNVHQAIVCTCAVAAALGVKHPSEGTVGALSAIAASYVWPVLWPSPAESYALTTSLKNYLRHNAKDGGLKVYETPQALPAELWNRVYTDAPPSTRQLTRVGFMRSHMVLRFPILYHCYCYISMSSLSLACC